MMMRIGALLKASVQGSIMGASLQFSIGTSIIQFGILYMGVSEKKGTLI